MGLRGKIANFYRKRKTSLFNYAHIPLRLDQVRARLSDYLVTQRGGHGEIGGSASGTDGLVGPEEGSAAKWNKRLPFLHLTYMLTRTQIGGGVV
jgi:hypothetical protein